MLKFGDLDSKFSKTNNEFEISTFEIGYMQNFVKIESYPKYPNLRVWAQNFRKQIKHLKSADSKQSTCEISLRLES